ncbi:hypothetical protein LIA77_09809 [Sarocladium implicatum]|nr:hypothetical protein LIA77_09809 [Sarocladium implicatum]
MHRHYAACVMLSTDLRLTSFVANQRLDPTHTQHASTHVHTTPGDDVSQYWNLRNKLIWQPELRAYWSVLVIYQGCPSPLWLRLTPFSWRHATPDGSPSANLTAV